MEKKRQILGFLSLCVFCIFALMGNVSAADCGAGTYLDGGVCVSCPPEYPNSDAGATSINQCFVHFEGKCVPGEASDCPENSKRCTWKTSEVISVNDYYGLPTNKRCKVNTLYCNSGYYKAADNQSCGLCADIPGYEGIYVKSSGSGYIEQCYKVCVPMCVRDACPAHGVCTYEDARAGGGGIFYPTADNIENCKPIVPSSCAMRVDCVDTGYTTFDAKNVTCNANTLTIKYNANGGTGSVATTTCLYDGVCTAAVADGLMRKYWDFVGWNTESDGSGRSYDAGESIKNIISDGEITLYAQWVSLNTKCVAGKYYDGEALVPCPAGSFCPGIGEAPAGEAGCATPCPSGWQQSEPGASSESECYKECPKYDVINGTAIPLNPAAYWKTQCEYRGVSINGNNCDIIDGVCTETSCSSTYEMVNGLCKPCNRPNALSYAPDGNCVIASCIIGYHVEGGKCLPDARKCTASYALSAHQTWDLKLGAYGTCIIEECANGYHVASNACVSDIQVCDIENGVGQMEWNHLAHAWGNCVATSCNVGYTMDPSLTNERWKQCGQCKNKFSVRGEQAVSSYIRECEIGACLYQGELYNLENNECIPICDVNGYEDETGTMKWNATTHKCDRRCKSGYLMWQ